MIGVVWFIFEFYRVLYLGYVFGVGWRVVILRMAFVLIYYIKSGIYFCFWNIVKVIKYIVSVNIVINYYVFVFIKSWVTSFLFL